MGRDSDEQWEVVEQKTVALEYANAPVFLKKLRELESNGSCDITNPSHRRENKATGLTFDSKLEFDNQARDRGEGELSIEIECA